MEDDDKKVPIARKRGNQAKFNDWLINLDVWGSFNPLQSQCYDIEVTRAAAYTKICTLVRRLELMCEFWR